jgi:hypothetical protein
MSLLRVERLQQIFRTIGATPYVLGGQPVSTLVIGPSGTGKTELVLSHIPPNSRVLTDFTFASIVAVLQQKPLPAWIVVPDLNAVLAHKPNVVNLAMGLMLALMGEGVTDIPGIDGNAKLAISGVMKHQPRGIHIGFISTMTPETFFTKRGPWRKTGFLRRILPIYYTHGLETREAVQFSIADGLDALDYTHVKLKPFKKTPIDIPADLAAEIRGLSDSLTANQLVWSTRDRTGTARTTQAIDFPYTLQKVLRVFAKAHALRSKRLIVGDADLRALKDCAKFVRYDRPEEI